MTILGIVISAVMYFIIAIALRDSIKNDIDEFARDAWYRPFSRTMVAFLRGYYKEIANLFSLVFPIYYGLKYGYKHGERLYKKIIIGKNDENRIIAWLF